MNDRNTAGGRAARVVGTAGHIDHGKTALVAALTGVDTDRLPEERRRGISIDLGFAPLDLGLNDATRLGFARRHLDLLGCRGATDERQRGR